MTARRRLLRRAIVRPAITALFLVLAYFVLPLDPGHDISTLTVLVVGLVAVCAICAWQVRRILHAEFPEVQAAEALVAVLGLYLVALYFCLTVFSTVGYGDISATSQLARGTVIVQIVGNLTIIAVGVRLLTHAVKWSQELRTER